MKADGTLLVCTCVRAWCRLGAGAVAVVSCDQPHVFYFHYGTLSFLLFRFIGIMRVVARPVRCGPWILLLGGGGALLRNGPPHPTATQVPRGWHTGSWGSELKGVCTALLALAKRRESKKVVGAFEVTRLATPHHHSARPAPRTPDLATPTGVRECVHTAPTSHMHLIKYSFYGFTAVWQLSRSRSQRDGRPECLLRIRYSISSGMRHADGR